MKVIISEPNKKTYTKEINGTLEEYQALVGGYIEQIVLHVAGKTYIGLCNEEGMYSEKPNRMINGDVIYGTLIIAGYDGKEDLQGLTEEEVINISYELGL